MNPKLSIIATGDELLDGRTINTNHSTLAYRLRQIGHRVKWGHIVGDDASDISSVISSTIGKSDICIITGGLGPTEDDKTMAILAETLNRPLTFNPDVWDWIQDLFKKRGRVCLDTNRKQAYFPEGAEIIPNPSGTAPGAYIQAGGTHIWVLPGVPKEMLGMYEQTVEPKIKSLFPSKIPNLHQVLVFGLGESHISHLIQTNLDLPKTMIVRYRLPFPCVEVQFEDSNSPISNTLISKIETIFSDHLIPHGFPGVTEYFSEICRKKSIKVGLAESCTGGFLSHLLTKVSGASSFFKQGIVSYANEAKEQYLGVSKTSLKVHGAVSAEVALEMSKGLEKSGIDLGIAITGIAGPEGGSDDKPVGTVFISVFYKGQHQVERYQFSGDRERIQSFAAYSALWKALKVIER